MIGRGGDLDNNKKLPTNYRWLMIIWRECVEKLVMVSKPKPVKIKREEKKD